MGGGRLLIGFLFRFGFFCGVLCDVWRRGLVEVAVR